MPSTETPDGPPIGPFRTRNQALPDGPVEVGLAVAGLGTCLLVLGLVYGGWVGLLLCWASLIVLPSGLLLAILAS